VLVLNFLAYFQQYGWNDLDPALATLEVSDNSLTVPPNIRFAISGAQLIANLIQNSPR